MVSVIIVNFHSAPLTKRAVESVLREDVDMEVFVVDNTATDNERKSLTSLLPSCVTVLFNKDNEGFAKACNKAYANTKGDLILLLNPDAYLLPGALLKLKKFLMNHHGAGAVGPRIYWDENKTFLLPHNILPSVSRELFSQAGKSLKSVARLNLMLYRWNNLKAWKASSPIKQKALSGGHLLLKRSAIENCGGLFDDTFFMYYEDSDLMLRMRKRGYDLFMEPEAEVVHRYIQHNDKIELMTETHRLYFNKNFRNSAVLKMAGKFSTGKPSSFPAHFTFTGRTKTPFKLDIPESFQDRWLFEWSPFPVFIPSVGCFGNGPQMRFSDDSWKLLGPGVYYTRVSSPDRIVFSSAFYSFEKEG